MTDHQVVLLGMGCIVFGVGLGLWVGITIGRVLQVRSMTKDLQGRK